jgi:hypothetical protein
LLSIGALMAVLFIQSRGRPGDTGKLALGYKVNVSPTWQVAASVSELPDPMLAMTDYLAWTVKHRPELVEAVKVEMEKGNSQQPRSIGKVYVGGSGRFTAFLMLSSDGSKFYNQATIGSFATLTVVDERQSRVLSIVASSGDSSALTQDDMRRIAGALSPGMHVGARSRRSC